MNLLILKIPSTLWSPLLILKTTGEQTHQFQGPISLSHIRMFWHLSYGQYLFLLSELGIVIAATQTTIHQVVVIAMVKAITVRTMTTTTTKRNKIRGSYLSIP